MLLVHGEVTVGLRHSLDLLQPRRTAGQLSDGTVVLVDAVERDHRSGTGRCADPIRARLLAFLEHRAPAQVWHPGELRGEVGHRRHREQTVGQLLRHGLALRPLGSDQHGHLDRPRSGVTWRVEHPHPRSLPLDGLAAQEALCTPGCSPPCTTT